MKQIKSFMAAITVALFLFSCEKMQEPTNENKAVQKTSSPDLQNKGGGIRQVYTLSNQTTGNKVLVYSRAANGTLIYSNTYSTGGTGTGSGLGNQGAIVLTGDNDGDNEGDNEDNLLLAVNPGSNSVSSFKVSDNALHLVSTVSSGGVRPVSVTVYNNKVYVLNSGSIGNISGFNLHENGSLHPIANSTRPLSSAGAGAAQVSFVADGHALAITEKMTNKIITYTINEQGIPGAMHSLSSAHPTPFGFAVGKNGIIYVSEAAGGTPNASTVSSYHISNSGMISLVDGPISAGQTAACWVVITNNGKYVYATNTGSNTVSSFETEHDGGLNVLNPIAGVTGMGSTPIDAALSNNSKFLYVLNSGNESIGVFSLGNNGNLISIQNVSGLPDGATGLAAK